jgi:hypothetical protein
MHLANLHHFLICFRQLAVQLDVSWVIKAVRVNLVICKSYMGRVQSGTSSLKFLFNLHRPKVDMNCLVSY